jgi:hypothetical protein
VAVPRWRAAFCSLLDGVGVPAALRRPHRYNAAHENKRHALGLGLPLPELHQYVVLPHPTPACHSHWSTAWNNGLGQFNQTGPCGIGYVLSTTAVDTPSDPNTTFSEHDFNDIGPIDLSKAHTSKYNSYIQRASGVA